MAAAGASFYCGSMKWEEQQALLVQSQSRNKPLYEKKNANYHQRLCGLNPGALGGGPRSIEFSNKWTNVC